MSLRGLVIFFGLLSMMGHTSSEWTQDLSAEVRDNFISSHGVRLIRVDVNLKTHEAKLKLVRSGLGSDVSLWRMTVSAGEDDVPISWDPNTRAWQFHYELDKHYTVYISKRKNNIETVPYLWAELP